MGGQRQFPRGGVVGSYARLRAEQLQALLGRARRIDAAPEAYTGCVSELSSVCARIDRDIERGYADALKQYAALYKKAAQAYLLPEAEAVARDDYRPTARDQQDVEVAFVVAGIERQAGLSGLSVSDEEVECCGYLGWLRH
jgi:hypothetical protein